MKNERNILAYLPHHTASALSEYVRSNAEADKYITEIRLHADRPTSISEKGKNVVIFCGKKDVCTKDEISQTLARLTEDSIHSCGETIKDGYINLEGGYRIGVCGTAATERGKIVGVHGFLSLCIRIPRAVTGVDGELIRTLRRGNTVSSALIYSPPGVGKTTLIRAAASTLSSGGAALRTAIIDTRREIFMEEMFENSIADVLSGYPRAAGIEIATRTLSPEVMICDEIGGEDEARAILSTQNAGVPLIATAHAENADALLMRPHIRSLIEANVFRYVIGISRKNLTSYAYTVHDRDAGEI